MFLTLPFCVCAHIFPAQEHHVCVHILFLHLCIYFALVWRILCVFLLVDMAIFLPQGHFVQVDTGISIGRSTWNTCVQRIQRDQFRTETQYQAGNEQRLLITAVGFYLSLHQQPSALCLRIVMQIKSLAGELIRRPLISERFVSQTEDSLAEGTQRGPPG